MDNSKQQQLADIARLRRERAAIEQSRKPVPTEEPKSRGGLELAGDEWEFIPADPDSDYQPASESDKKFGRAILMIDAATAIDGEAALAEVGDRLRHEWLDGEISEAEAQTQFAAAQDALRGGEQ
jgi:hypothetical protein